MNAVKLPDYGSNDLAILLLALLAALLAIGLIGRAMKQGLGRDEKWLLGFSIAASVLIALGHAAHLAGETWGHEQLFGASWHIVANLGSHLGLMCLIMTAFLYGFIYCLPRPPAEEEI